MFAQFQIDLILKFNTKIIKAFPVRSFEYYWIYIKKMAIKMHCIYKCYFITIFENMHYTTNRPHYKQI